MRGPCCGADEAVEKVQAVALGKHGKVRVGHAAAAVDILRRTLSAFSRTHPDVSVDLRDMTSVAMVGGLRDGTLDVALTVAISPRDLEGLAVENLGAYPICVAVDRKHRFARQRAVRLSELAREPIVGRSRKEYPEAHAGVLKILEPITRSPNLVEEYDSFPSLIAAVEAGRGVAFIVRTTSLLAGTRVVLRPLKPAPPLLPVVMAYHAGRFSAATAAFLATTRAAASKSPRSKRTVLNV
jgi:DNA-binding transcriptional LysR family regulator